MQHGGRVAGVASGGVGLSLDMSVDVHQGSMSMVIGDHDLQARPDVFVSGWPAPLAGAPEIEGFLGIEALVGGG